MNASRVVFRPFTTEDWYGFSGATSWGEGMPPIIGDIKVDGNEGVIVVDREGSTIFWSVEERQLGVGPAGEAMWNASLQDPEILTRMVALLPAEVTTPELESFGFSVSREGPFAES